MPKRRIMRSFKISEISAVDVPAQEGARQTIIKRSKGSDDLPNAVKNVADGYSGSGLLPAAAAYDVQALDFDEVLAEREAREAAHEVKDDIWGKWCALQASFRTIAEDESVSAADKVTAMQTSLRQFISSLSEESTVIADAVSKSLNAVPAIAELLKVANDEGDESMNATEKKQFDELQKKVATLTKQLAAATSDETVEKAAKAQDELEKARVELDKLKSKAEEDAVAKSELEALAKMSDAEKAHYNGLTDDETKKAFREMASEDRKAAISLIEKNDETLKIDGHVVRKSAVGETQFAVMKSQQQRIEKQDEEIRKERERREEAEFSKRADDELGAFAGEHEQKVSVLKAMSKMDEEARGALQTMLKAGGKAIEAAFTTIGGSGEQAVKRAQDFNKRVEEIKARDNCTKSEAMSKARKDFPDEYQAYRQGSVSN